MSRYISGKQAMPLDILQAVSKYINVFDVPPRADPAEQPRDREGAGPGFAGLVRQLTDEPLLGPRQAAVVDAVTERLRNGSPMSADDGAALTALMRLLGLDAESAIHNPGR
jgi:hypothetical protein